ncbi:MAG: hypothetical protein KIS66_06185 [Fimbriimonadaceae bacterium]|nr:hypothetical protein [Fimbriimonadaceae bacterium]
MLDNLVKLGEVAQQTGSPIIPSRFPTESFELYSIPAYDAGAPEIVLGSAIGSNKTLLHSACILFSKLNPRIPRIWNVPKTGSMRQVCSTEFIPFRLTNPAVVDSEYLAYMMASPQFLEPIQSQVNSSTKSHQRVKPDVIAGQRLPVPAISEQKRIVILIKECMERIDEIQNLRESAKIEVNAIHRSYYHEQYERLSSSGKTVRLDQAAKFMGGGTPSKQNPSFWRGTIPWISPKDMKRRDLYDATDHISNAAISGSSAKLISDPSVLFVVRGMILAHTLPTAVNRVPVAINQDMKAAIPNKGFDVDFLAAMIRGAEKKLLSQVEIAGHGTCRLQQPHWTGLPIPVLTPTEQADVVAATQEFESITDRLKSEVRTNESEAMRAAVLRKAYAGEL